MLCIALILVTVRYWAGKSPGPLAKECHSGMGRLFGASYAWREEFVRCTRKAFYERLEA